MEVASISCCCVGMYHMQKFDITASKRENLSEQRYLERHISEEQQEYMQEREQFSP